MKKRLVVIDGNSLLYRSFFALPKLSTKDGIVTNGIYGFLNIYYRILEDYKPDYMSIVFDKKGDTFRHKEYKDYKAGRAKMPDELGIQFPILKEILDTMKITYLEAEGYEADDIAGTLARLAEEKEIETILVTGDRDYLQLIDENTKVVFNVRGISEIKYYDKKVIEEEYGLTPNQLIDLKALVGDKSDNIPGVPGIGDKTGLKLIKEYGSMEEVYKNLDNMKKSAMKRNLEENRVQAAMSKSLATIFRNVPIENDIESLEYKQADNKEVLEKFQEYELKSLYSKVSDGEDEVSIDSVAEDIEYSVISSAEELDSMISEIDKELYINGCYEEDSTLVGMGLVVEGKHYYIDFPQLDMFGYMSDYLSPEVFFEKMKVVIEDESIAKYGHNIKDEIILFKKNGVEFEEAEFDSMVALYLINPSLGNYSINSVAREVLKLSLPEDKDILGTGRNKKQFAELEESDRAKYTLSKLDTVYKAKELLEKDIHDMEMDELFNEVEMPLVTVLADMEFRGFKVDEEKLDEQDVEISEKLNRLAAVIHEMAGEDFNINSPKQLSEILFEKLELPALKKTKTGYSTNAEVLEGLVDKHPIINNIIEYRQVAKLKSTYIDGLRAVIDRKTGRIHSKFNQTIAATGRISSTDPNLQNIPIRTEEGRKIRQMFVAGSSEYKLVDADYSQIELRVLAHISDDEKLKSAFYEESDIHRKTASEVFDIPMDEVTSEMRSRAKAVNFGIIYGISDFGLSRDLKITRKEAKSYIDSYLENYPKVKEYMEDIVEAGKKQGYVETILHRRRYIPELKSRNFNIRGFGERIALNTPIQGSAADIIKIAMVNVYRELKNRKFKSKLILQVHDELIIEAHEDELEAVKELLKEKMESAVKLSVPLEADMEVGDSWYDTK